VPLLVEHSPPEALRTALLTAAGQHKSDLMRQILARLPDPSELLVEDAESRLTSALLLMSDTELQILEQAGLQLPLWAAARFGRLERMKELIAAGADVNEPPANGTRETPLLLAVRNGRYEAAKLLLASKANPDTRSGNMTQPTPLHEAAEKGDVSLVRLLTAHGVALNPLDSLERPPLYYAVAAQNREVSAVLLKAGADPNIQVHSGEHDPAGNRLKVPLWKLAKDPDLVRLLKSKGAR
jgi:ankyrin repeat protein